MEFPKIGYTQGRLVNSPKGQLQCFPKDHWESEFYLANALGIDFIELLVERKHNIENPFWTDKGLNSILGLVSANNLCVHAVCNDYVIDNELHSSNDVLQQALDVIERAARVGCATVVLPLFERSELNMGNLDMYIDPVRVMAEKAQQVGVTISLETILTGRELVEALERIDSSVVKVVYDTGNRVAFGHDLAGDIRLLGKNISHVHVKDKNSSNENVLLGTGLVNFKEVFDALSDIQYAGAYTFETQRGTDPLRTAKYNIQFLKYFYGEGFGR